MLNVNEVPCDYSNIETLAEEHCNVLKTSPQFTTCHDAVDVTDYYNE